MIGTMDAEAQRAAIASGGGVGESRVGGVAMDADASTNVERHPEWFSPVDEVIAELRAGRMVILTDDESRENEGDLVMAAEFATPESITFMLSEARGYLCLSLTEADCDRLKLEPQASRNTSVRGTPFTVSIDGHPKHGFTTGVSAPERARVIRMAIDGEFGADDFVRPGHINPLRSRDGGVLVRTGQTEGSVDLCRLADLYPAAIIIEIMRDDGEMARLPDLRDFAQKHGLKMCSVNQLIEHRLSRTRLVHRAEPVRGVEVDTTEGVFTMYAFQSRVDVAPHLALCLGGVGELDDRGRVIEQSEPTLIRVHRRQIVGDVFGGRTSDGQVTSRSLHAALKAIREAGRGALIYMRPGGVGDDLELRLKKIATHGGDAAVNAGIVSEAMPMDKRDYGIGGQIVRELGVSKMRLLTNHPRELPGLGAFGLEIVEHVGLG
jgi:3,4-dihydroxy 2-butanone 4-phosphate synthase/GTP cyclohydrolase II